MNAVCFMYHIPSQNKLSSFVPEVRKAQGAEYLETAFWRRYHLIWYLKDGDWGKARIQGEDRKKVGTKMRSAFLPAVLLGHNTQCHG